MDHQLKTDQQSKQKPKKTLKLSVQDMPKQQTIVCDQYGSSCNGC